jgi:hypothetical protein
MLAPDRLPIWAGFVPNGDLGGIRAGYGTDDAQNGVGGEG